MRSVHEHRNRRIVVKRSGVSGEGLFLAKGVHELSRGDFIDFYRGEVSRSVKNDKCMSHSTGYILCASNDPLKYPVAFANEPSEGETANAMYFGLYWGDTHATALFATKRIRPGQEITVHYGQTYNDVRRLKGYKAGRPGRTLRVDELQMPLRPPHDASTRHPSKKFKQSKK